MNNKFKILLFVILMLFTVLLFGVYNGGSGDGYSSAATSGDQSLPVEIISFTADIINSNEVALEWVTGSEIENVGFILERRSESDDGNSEWTEIASYITDEALRGQGSVSYRTKYSYIDTKVKVGKRYDYRLADVSYAGVKEYYDEKIEGIKVESSEFLLMPSYPNPFNPVTNISFSIPKQESGLKASLHIYNIKGECVATLLNAVIDAGEHSVIWDASAYSSGIYFVRLRYGQNSTYKKLMLVR